MIKTKTTNKITKAAKSAKPTKKSPQKRPSFSLPGKNPAKPIILAVIGLAGLMVIMATFSAFYFTPEKVVKNEIESIVKEYYENAIYENIIKSDSIASGKKSLSDVMKLYSEKGFSRIFLRQLLLVNSEKHQNAISIIKKYCDENLTSIVIYPDAPYGKSDYHIEYEYSCKF